MKSQNQKCLYTHCKFWIVTAPSNSLIASIQIRIRTAFKFISKLILNTRFQFYFLLQTHIQSQILICEKDSIWQAGCAFKGGTQMQDVDHVNRCDHYCDVAIKYKERNSHTWPINNNLLVAIPAKLVSMYNKETWSSWVLHSIHMMTTQDLHIHNKMEMWYRLDLQESESNSWNTQDSCAGAFSVGLNV